MQNRPELSSSDRLRRSALRLLRAGCPDEADLLNNAASKIDTGETDIDLAAALMECADRFGRRRRITTRHMREVALRLVMIS